MIRPTRRDFLKLASLTPVAYAAHRLLPKLGLAAQDAPPNIIVLVFDAWSANHMRLYGYPRPTMPNVDAFAERATVYHRHYSAGTFTVPGTASLLSGLHPWSHRAFALGGEIASPHRRHQLFSLLAASHHTLGYSQNEYADLLLAGTGSDLEIHPSISSFSLHQNLFYSLPLFSNDSFLAYSSFENDIFQKGKGADGSLFIGPLRRLLRWRSTYVIDAEYRDSYPRGLPAATDLFRLEDVVDGGIGLLRHTPGPFFAYLHFFPPHGFYRPKGKYNHAFEDDFHPAHKPVHPLIHGDPGYDAQESQALRYDQYVASWDAEVARVLEYIRTSGLMDKSYVILTSDHGELFERGVIGHYCPLIYDPLVHVPLLISAPGQAARVDIQTATSSVDLLPTIAAVAGLQRPSWAEGQILPALGGREDPGRSIFSMDAKMNSAFASLKRFSFALARNGHRMVHYRYPESDVNSFELYDLESDPDELHDLFPSRPKVALEIQQELLDKLSEIDQRFQGQA